MCFWNLQGPRHILFWHRGACFGKIPPMNLISAQKCHFWHGKMAFLIFWPKIRRRMLQNAILSPEIERTNPNWSKTNRVCQKITSLSLNRDFLAKLNFWNFHLSFPAENERENSHFSKLKFWKKCKILTFQKSCLESFWWCLSANPLVWGWFGCVLEACRSQNTFFWHGEAYFGRNSQMKLNLAQKCQFWLGKWQFWLLGQKCAAGCFKMQFWARKSKEHIRNNLKLTGFAKNSLPYH